MGKATKSKSKAATKKTALSKARKPVGGEPRFPRRIIFVLLFAGLIAGVLLGWGNWIWQKVDPIVRSGEEYRLNPNSIEVQPTPPAWIRGDIRTEVLRNATLIEPLSMLDEKLPRRIADAFEFHPWVSSAKVTLQYPGRVQVELTYRRPVAQLLIENKAGEEQVVLDSTGVRLPETDLTAKEVAGLAVVDGIIGVHLPLVGQRVEDTRMRGAVEVAAQLATSWKELQLAKIVPLTVLQGEKEARYQAFQLVGQKGETYVWGAAPSESPSGEPSPNVKLQRLQAARKAAREGISSTSHTIDLRNEL